MFTKTFASLINHNVNITQSMEVLSKISDNEIYKDIISYLNQKLNSNYKYSTKSTKDCIKARLNEGFTLEEFKIVIDKKYNEWINTEMEQYLRPITLFSNKFEGYLNSPIKKGGNNNAEYRKDYGGLDLSRFE